MTRQTERSYSPILWKYGTNMDMTKFDSCHENTSINNFNGLKAIMVSVLMILS